jgi:hypothetical protein
MKVLRRFCGLERRTLFLLLALCLVSVEVNATRLCSDVFRGTEFELTGALFRDLEILQEQTEALLAAASREYVRSENWDQFLDTTLTQLGEQSQILDSLQTRALGDQPIAHAEVTQLRDSLQVISRQLEEGPRADGGRLVNPGARATFAEVIETPSLVRPEFVYSVETPHNGVLRVLFSDKVVDEVFLSADASLTQSLTKALRVVNRGLFGSGYEGVGITKLRGTGDFVEIRTRGHYSNFRLYGYLHEGVIHFVTWTKASNHGGHSIITRFAPSIRAAQLARGH